VYAYYVIKNFWTLFLKIEVHHRKTKKVSVLPSGENRRKGSLWECIFDNMA